MVCLLKIVVNIKVYRFSSSLTIKAYNVKIRDIDHLVERLGEAWEEISQPEIDNIVNYFRKRVTACINAGGKGF